MDRWGLFTDYYELTMAAAFHAEGHDELATFELFVRQLPPGRTFLVACGVETALERLDAFSFGPDELSYLRSVSSFSEDFLEHLGRLRFTGEVRAVAEGELVLAQEPLLSVTAPLVEAQLVETLLLNVVGFETMVATKAARIALAAGGRTFVDFSARRDHGADAAVLAARAAYVGGASATSLVEAGRRYGLPLSGTMAHSYVMAHEHEQEAFAAFLRQYGDAAVLLLDTYDTVQGAKEAVAAMRQTGIRRAACGSIRATWPASPPRCEPSSTRPATRASRSSRRATSTRTGWRRWSLPAHPIDAFGVGTRMGTSADAPYLAVVYKLVEQGGEARVKTSPGKASYPGRKQVWRRPGVDTLALDGEPGPPGGPTAARPRCGTAAGARGRRPISRRRGPAAPRALADWASGAPRFELSPGLEALLGAAVGAHQE